MNKKQATPSKLNSIENIEGVPVQKTPETKRAWRWGVWVILAFVAGFLLWATVAPLESAALAPGKVVASGRRRVIQHLDGGIVTHIYVKDGSKVKKGQILIKLDDDSATLTVTLLENEVYELAANQARLTAERDNQAQITFSNLLLKNKDKPSVAAIIANQKSLFRANVSAYHNQLRILNQRIEQLHSQINGTEAQLKANEAQYKLILTETKEVKALYKKRLIELSRLLSLQREQARLAGVRGEKMAAIAAFKQKIGETEHEIITLKSKRHKEVLESLLQTHQELIDALKKLRTAQAILARAAIRSPQDGIVVGLKVHTIGGVIKPGEPIMDIVPTKEALVVEARVSPLDIDVVHPGLLAKIDLIAFRSRNTPLLVGKVTYVSADAFQEENDGESYYLARIEIGQDQLKRLKPGQMLYPGMPVTVMIVTGEQTFFEYIFGPVKQSFGRAFREQ